MSDINRVILIGRLTRDPELRFTPSGTAMCNFAIANNYIYSKDGEKKEQVSYFDCVAWNKYPGEVIDEHCKKGTAIAIEGRLQQRTWDDDNGQKKSKVEIVVEGFNFVGGKREE